MARGTRHAGQGPDPALKKLAARTQTRTGDSTAAAEIADGWRAYAEQQQPEHEQPGIRAFAADLYRAALPGVAAGPRRQQIESRIAAAASESAGRPGGGTGVRVGFAFDKPGVLDSFEITGNAAINKDGEPVRSKGTPSLVTTEQSFGYPIRFEADANTLPGGNFDTRMMVFTAGKEAGGIGVFLGNSCNRLYKVVLPKRDIKFGDMTINVGQVYKVVITVDEQRKAKVRVGGKTLASEVIPHDVKLEGKIVLSGGQGSVVFKRCVVQAKPVEAK